MIDVVFLLLVFFMLAARFGQEGAIDLRLASGGGAAWDGPPRLVQVGGDGLGLNGRPLAEGDLVAALAARVTAPDDLILLQAAEGVPVQRLLDVIAMLESSGFANLALVPP